MNSYCTITGTIAKAIGDDIGFLQALFAARLILDVSFIKLSQTVQRM